METIKILIVEDDPDINHLLSKIMKKQGYETVQAFSGSEGKLLLSMEKFDLLLLDLMLPGIMGEELIHDLRTNSNIPIIVLSAKSSLQERVKVLNLGADDYLTKPFETEEVVARVNGALRRCKCYSSQSITSTPEILTFKNLKLHVEHRDATLNGIPLSFTVHEFDILALLMKHPGKVYSRESLYEEIWQGGYYGEDNTVNVHVSNIRKKLAAIDSDEYISTVWGIGFKLASSL